MLQVATKQLEPFIIVQADGTLTGFSVDLWDALAKDLGLRYEWAPITTVAQLFVSVRGNQADLAISGISMTPERERLIDFSHPYFEAGLRILTPTEQNLSLIQILQSIFTPNLLKVLGIGLVSLFILPLQSPPHSPFSS